MRDEWLTIAGPVGALQARLSPADKISKGIAVLCHPHPQYGGSMEDAVLEAATEVLLSHGIACLRFNFRGVGASEGSYDNGRGETDDAIAMITWAQQRSQSTPWLLGYSFGSAVAWRAAQKAQIARLLLIAPPIGRMPYEGAVSTPTTLVAGSEDDYVDWSAVQDFATRLPQGSQTHCIDGADHFFGGAWQDLQRAIATSLAPQ